MADDYVVTSAVAPDSAPPTADTAPPAVETPASASAPDAPVLETDQEDDELQDDEQPRAKRNLDRRFRRLTGRIRERDDIIAELRTQVDTMLRTQAPQPASEPAQTPRGAPQTEDYATYEDYVSALVDQRAQAVVEATLRQQEETAAAQREHVAKAAAQRAYDQRLMDVIARHPDYDEVLDDATYPVSPQLLEELRTSELGPDLAYYLAQHEEEGKRLSALAPRQLTREITKLEMMLEGTIRDTPAPSPSARPAATQRPRPLTPVSGASAESVFNPNTASFEEYKAWRNKGGGR